MSVVSATPTDTVPKASIMVSLAPRRSTRAAAKGPIRPNSTRLTETAMEIVARDQPNSCSSGTIRTPGVARMAAAVSRVRNETASTTQA